VREAEAVSRIISDYTREQQELTHSVHVLLFNMKGALTRNDAWALTPNERRDMFKIIDERMKLAQKMGVPYL